MNEIVQDVSTQSFICAIENNLFAIMSALKKWPRAEVHDEGTMKWSITDIPFPLFNSIVCAQLLPERIDATIQDIIAHGRERKVPLLWWTGPATQPPDLGKHLEGHGFLNGGCVPGMAVDMTKLKENLPMPEGFVVQQAKDDETLQLWSVTTGAGFGMEDFAIEAFYDFVNHVGPDTMRPYIGWLNSRPVATSLLFLAAGVAGIYNVATIPDARRRGIGATMTVLPLKEAQAIGYRVGILHSSEMGEDVYRSLGFQEYCKIGQYLWSPEHPEGMK